MTEPDLFSIPAKTPKRARKFNELDQKAYARTLSHRDLTSPQFLEGGAVRSKRDHEVSRGTDPLVARIKELEAEVARLQVIINTNPRSAWKLKQVPEGTIELYTETEGALTLIKCSPSGDISLYETPQFGGEENLVGSFATICAAMDTANNLC